MKRLFDVVFSLVFLIVLLPVIVIVSILIFLESGLPIIFKQVRVGKDGKDFILYKFRTMKKDYNAEKNLDFSKDILRTTKLGKFLRRMKIDEIPQLLNILKGNMSVVGPRPTLRYQVDKYNQRQFIRLSVKPGLTGLAQVNGGIHLPWEERIQYDLKYIENISFTLDMIIILKTVLVAVFGENIFYSSNSTKLNKTLD